MLTLKDTLLAKAPTVMVKLSPMLDWHKTITDFAGAVHEVHIVSTGNECKELLLVLGRGRCASPLVVCVNDGQVLSYKAGDNSDNQTPISDSALVACITGSITTMIIPTMLSILRRALRFISRPISLHVVRL